MSIKDGNYPCTTSAPSLSKLSVCICSYDYNMYPIPYVKSKYSCVPYAVSEICTDRCYILSKYTVGLELAIDPPPPRGNFVHYGFLKVHYIRQKIKDVSPLRVAALTYIITLYTLPPEIALNIPDNVSTMTCSYVFAC